MPELVVVVPSRGRPHTVAELAATFRETCAADTRLVFAVDQDDPAAEDYSREVERAAGSLAGGDLTLMIQPSHTMVEALNLATAAVIRAAHPPAAVGFMNDDHRPRRPEHWDRVYLDTLAARPGIAYGNDLVMGREIPTQWVMSTAVARALGRVLPPGLWHLYGDNYIRRLGEGAGCITYREDVVNEHLTPLVGKRPADEGYLRVNAGDWYEHDRAELERHWAAHGDADVRAVKEAVAAVAR